MSYIVAARGNQLDILIPPTGTCSVRSGKGEACSWILQEIS